MRTTSKTYTCTWPTTRSTRTTQNMSSTNLWTISVSVIRNHWPNSFKPSKESGYQLINTGVVSKKPSLKLWFRVNHTFNTNFEWVRLTISPIICVSRCWDSISCLMIVTKFIFWRSTIPPASQLKLLLIISSRAISYETRWFWWMWQLRPEIKPSIKPRRFLIQGSILGRWLKYLLKNVKDKYKSCKEKEMSTRRST